MQIAKLPKKFKDTLARSVAVVKIFQPLLSSLKKLGFGNLALSTDLVELKSCAPRAMLMRDKEAELIMLALG